MMMKPQLPQVSRRLVVRTRTPVHPGHLLEKLFLVPLGMNQTEAASRLGVSRRRLHEVVRGRRALTPDTAARCALHFGADAQFWLVMQAQHDAFLASRRLYAARR